MQADEHASFESLFSFVALVITIVMYMSGMPTVMEIHKKNDSSGIPYFPWCVQVINCLMWFQYGQMSDNNTLIICNGVGATLGVFYLAVVLRYSRGKSGLLKPYGITVAATCVLLSYIGTLEDVDNAIFQSGMLSSGMSISMFASPLADVAKVVQEKDTSSMIFGQSLMFFLCTLSWTGFGFFINDRFVMIPNMIGSCFAGVQLVLFRLYPSAAAPGSGGGLHKQGYP